MNHSPSAAICQIKAEIQRVHRKLLAKLKSLKFKLDVVELDEARAIVAGLQPHLTVTLNSLRDSATNLDRTIEQFYVRKERAHLKQIEHLRNLLKKRETTIRMLMEEHCRDVDLTVLDLEFEAEEFGMDFDDDDGDGFDVNNNMNDRSDDVPSSIAVHNTGEKSDEPEPQPSTSAAVGGDATPPQSD